MAFCSQCKEFNINLAAFVKHPGNDTNPRLDSRTLSLGNLEEISLRTSQCCLCRLISAAFHIGPLKYLNQKPSQPSNSDKTHATSPSQPDISIHGTWINALGPSREQREKSSTLCILLWPESPYVLEETYKVVVRAMSPMMPWYPHFGRMVDQPYLDFDLIKSWLHECEKQHASCHRAVSDQTARPTKTFLVIDAKNKCVVEAPDCCRYLALSYVWGSTTQLRLTTRNFHLLTTQGGLSTQPIPKVISDAITLTSKLDERYLWVDSLCIVQDSDVVRQQSVDDMDRIYINALLTVIAGTGTCADDMLPGVTEIRGAKMYFQPVSPSLTLSAHFDFKDYLEGSAYSQRGWTFQEQQLATRSLIFVDNGQAYFSCKEAVFSEEVVSERLTEPDCAMKAGAQIIKIDPDSASLWPLYRRAVQLFTVRQLTYENDILNAFSGILRTLCKEPKLEGIPTPIFDLALLWQPAQSLRHRVGFASWSWAGWCGPVRWYDDETVPDPQKTRQSEQQQVENWLKDKNWIVWYSSWGSDAHASSQANVGPLWLRGTAPPIKDHRTRFLDLPNGFAPTATLLRDRLRRHEKQKQHGRYLQFWTVSAYFHISPVSGTATMRYTSAEPESIGEGLRLFQLLNIHEKECGWVLLDETWVSQANRTQEFIMLSEGRHRMKYRCPHENQPYYVHDTEDFLEFNAMMIVWKGGIAERAGLGRVMKASLPDSCRRGMKWKEILLG